MTCGKFIFPSRRTARAAAARQQATNRFRGRSTNKTDVYHCPMCGGWHITSFSHLK